MIVEEHLWCDACRRSTSGRCYDHQLGSVSSVPYPTMPGISLTQKGWECPKCGRVYSPSTAMCYFCPGTVAATTVSLGSVDPK